MRKTIALIAATAASVALSSSGCGESGTSVNAESITQQDALIAFECKTSAPMNDGAIHVLKFSIRNLHDESRAELDDDDDEWPVEVTPESSPLRALNANYEWVFQDGKFTLAGDDDGFYYPTLVLYENSGYEKGYVEVDDDKGVLAGGDDYSVVACTLSPVATESSSCEDAALDKNGVCRMPDGRFAKASCCVASPECTEDSDCSLAADLCTGCDCRALESGASLPVCEGPGVKCNVEPCLGKVARCVQNKCSTDA